MVKANDNCHADHGGFVINTGTGTRNGGAFIPAGAQPQHSRAAGDALAALVSLFVISTGTNTMSATGRGAQIAGGAGSVIADGAPAVNTNSAGAVHTTGALAQPCRTAGGSFSDQMLWASRFLYKTCADTMSVGGAGSDGATAVNANSAWAVNTTGALAQPWRAAGGAFPDQVLIPGSSRFSLQNRHRRYQRHRARRPDRRRRRVRRRHRSCHRKNQQCWGCRHYRRAGPVLAHSRRCLLPFSEQMLFPRPFVFKTGTGRANASGLVINSGAGSIITIGPGVPRSPAPGPSLPPELRPSTPTMLAPSTYTSEGVAVSRPTSTMIGIGMLGGAGILGIGVVSSKNDAIRFLRAAAVGFSLKRKLRWWAAKLLKKIKDD
ncbi:hypothetical protein ACQ4PT_015091 [Festuca glaucescens]